MSTILLIDDEPDITAPLARFFERSSHHVEVAHSADEGIAAFRRVHPDLVMVDIGLPDASGLELLDTLSSEQAVAIMLTGHADVETAVEAMRRGAEDFVTKPVELTHLREVADKALEKARLRDAARHLIPTPADSVDWTPWLGRSPAMQAIGEQLALIARSERTTVLLLGESGTGKGRIAELVHAQSPRASRAYLELDCATLTGTALDVQLFGSERAGDAGAVQVGLIEAADNATLFLDEITGLDAAMQAKLLRVLEGRSFRRVGGVHEVRAAPRLIAASQRDLATEASTRRFREDLYYRLAIMPITLPPLRARAQEDLVAVIGATVESVAAAMGDDAPTTVADKALDRLLRYSWPGNLRELRAVVERAMLLSRGSHEIRAVDLPAEVRGATGGSVDQYVPKTLADVERVHIDRTLRAFNGNRTRVADVLGISRGTLHKKIKEYHIKVDG